MPTEIILPRVDMDMTTGRVSRWYVDEGATIEKGQPLFEIETDKAAMEIESPGSGVLRRSSVENDGAIPVGSVIGWICAPGETAPAADERPPQQTARPVETGGEPISPDPGETDRPSVGQTAVAATPLARRLAAQQGVSLDDLEGSGPRRRIQARDVEDAARRSPRLENDPAPQPKARPGRTVASPRLVHLRDGDGRPLLLLHGFGADLNAWRGFAAVISPGRPVVALDLPGHGGAAALPIPSLDALVEAAAGAVVDAELRGIDLVGHSLGGAVAAELSADPALDIRSLFLIAPAGLGPDMNGEFLAGFTRARSERSLAPWLRLLVSNELVLSPAFIRATARTRERDAVMEAQAALAAALFPDGTQTISIRATLDALVIPVRVVFGTEDRIIPARHALDLPGVIAVHRLRGLGHLPQLEDPALVGRILSDHLGR